MHFGLEQEQLTANFDRQKIAIGENILWHKLYMLSINMFMQNKIMPDIYLESGAVVFAEPRRCHHKSRFQSITARRHGERCKLPQRVDVWGGYDRFWQFSDGQN